MMKTVCLQDWVLKIDVEKTKEYYDSITVEEGCNCDYCRNYIKNCKTFSQEVLDFYTMLGIDPQKKGNLWSLKRILMSIYIWDSIIW